MPFYRFRSSTTYVVLLALPERYPKDSEDGEEEKCECQDRAKLPQTRDEGSDEQTHGRNRAEGAEGTNEAEGTEDGYIGRNHELQETSNDYYEVEPVPRIS